MKWRNRSRTRFALVSAVVVLAVLGLTSCCCDDDDECCTGQMTAVFVEHPIGEAKHWVVLHEKASPSGEPWEICAPAVPGDVIAYLPKCLKVKEGDTIGFINYSKKDATISHGNSLNGPEPFTLASKEEKIFVVVVSDTQKLLDIKSTMSHGGPGMIVEP